MSEYSAPVKSLFEGLPDNPPEPGRFAPSLHCIFPQSPWIRALREVNCDEDKERAEKNLKKLEGIKEFLCETSAANTCYEHYSSVYSGVIELNDAFREFTSNQDVRVGMKSLKQSVTDMMKAYLPCLGKENEDFENVLEAIKADFEEPSDLSPEKDPSSVPERLKKLSKSCYSKNVGDFDVDYVLGTISMLYYEISPSSPPLSDNKESEVRVGVVSVHNDEQGTSTGGSIGKLRAKIDTERKVWTGMILPDPRSIFICFDKEFFSGIKKTYSSLKKQLDQKQADVFWNLSLNDWTLDEWKNSQNINSFNITGDSMGLAFYTGIRAILEDS